MNLNKASLFLEPTQVRIGDKYRKTWDWSIFMGLKKALEPKEGSYWENWLIIFF